MDTHYMYMDTQVWFKLPAVVSPGPGSDNSENSNNSSSLIKQIQLNSTPIPLPETNSINDRAHYISSCAGRLKIYQIWAFFKTAEFKIQFLRLEDLKTSFVILSFFTRDIWCLRPYIWIQNIFNLKIQDMILCAGRAHWTKLFWFFCIIILAFILFKSRFEIRTDMNDRLCSIHGKVNDMSRFLLPHLLQQQKQPLFQRCALIGWIDESGLLIG